MKKLKVVMLSAVLMALVGCQMIKDYTSTYKPGDITRSVVKILTISNDAMELISAVQDVKDNYLEVRTIVGNNASLFGDDIETLRRLDSLVIDAYTAVKTIKEETGSIGAIVDLAGVLRPIIPITEQSIAVMDKHASSLPAESRIRYEVIRKDVDGLLVLARQAINSSNKSERIRRAINLAKSLASILAAGIEIKSKLSDLS